MILGGVRIANGGGMDRSSNNKPTPPTHVTYHRSVGASMQSIMTDITNEDGGGGGLRGSQRHPAAIDTSRELSYEQDYDNMSWKGYVQEIEERDEEQNLKKEHSQFTLKSSPSQLQVLEEVEIDNTPEPSQSKIEEEEVKTVDENLKTSVIISPDFKRQQKQHQQIQAHGCEDPVPPPVETESPNDIGSFFKMGNFFGRRRHNHYSSEPSSPPRPLCAANQRQISEPAALQSKNDQHPYTRMLEEEVIRLKLELAYAQSQSDQHQMEQNKLTEERDSLKSHNIQLSLLNNELSQTNATQMVQISGLQQHKDIIIQKCDKISQEFIKCQTELKTLNSENENFKKKSNEQDVVIFYLQENIEKTTKEKDELRIANQQLCSDNNNNNAAVDWQQQQQQNQQQSNSINESMNSMKSAPSIFSSNKSSHIVQMEFKDLSMKNQYLQQENKQLKDLIHQDSNPDLINNSSSKRRTSSINAAASQRSLELNNTNSYHTVISNTIEEVEKFSITQQQNNTLHNNSNTSPSIRRPSIGRTRSGTFNSNLYSYQASPASYALPTSIER